MDTSRIRTFLMVKKEGSFTKAAEKLFITPTAVKKQIDALENELETTLFFRTSAGCQLTKSGEILEEHAFIILNEINDVIDKIRIADSKTSNELRIGHSVKFEYNFISNLTNEFSDCFENQYIRLIRYKKVELATALLNNKIDCIFLISPQDSLFQSFESEIIGHTRIHAIMKKNHPLANQKVVSFEDLLPYTIFISSLLNHSIYSKFDTAIGNRLRVLDKEDRNELLYSLRKDGIILYPCSVQHDLSIPFEDYTMEIALYYKKHNPIDSKKIDFLKKFIQNIDNRFIL